ncbi:hypothetical protein OG196_14645 [Kitasatospora purpeofusca]|uniref:hypothetical protein n=1 Tax=Kitasatospora purpeofusca TaxID=67352 RepID=UPI002E124CA5|nr:hypothetical protein OG196_14645 [Kitasatospora purpeofusca]
MMIDRGACWLCAQRRHGRIAGGAPSSASRGDLRFFAGASCDAWGVGGRMSVPHGFFSAWGQ